MCKFSLSQTQKKVVEIFPAIINRQTINADAYNNANAAGSETSHYFSHEESDWIQNTHISTHSFKMVCFKSSSRLEYLLPH